MTEHEVDEDARPRSAADAMTAPESGPSKTVDCRELHPRCEFCERREAAKDSEIARLRAALRGDW
jgi:hypothetical protein